MMSAVFAVLVLTLVIMLQNRGARGAEEAAAV